MNHRNICTLVLFYYALLLMLSFHCLYTSSNSNSTSDMHALLSFKSQVHTDPFSALQSWSNNNSLHFCDWHGVTCDIRNLQQRVTELKLNSLNLAGYISPFVANLSFLERLHLEDNNLEGPIPEDIGFLAHLQHLNLSCNSLSGVIPPTLFHSCARLQQVSLEDNILGGTVLGNLSNCLELRSLAFSNNSLEGEIPKELFSLPKIEFLSLLNNKITGNVPPEIGNAITLERIFLSQNLLTGCIPTSVGNLTAMILLDLADNDIIGGIPASLGRLSNLKDLRLQFNHLNGAIPPSIWNLSSLTKLDLQENNLSGTLPEGMGSRLPRLAYLELNDNKFHGPLPTSLGNVSSLKLIQLCYNKFSGKIPESYGLLQSLFHLHVAGNNLEATNAVDWNFFDALTNCTNLQVLVLQDNKLGGVLPRSLANLSTSLEVLSISQNQIAGSIPVEIGNLANLTTLFMSSNLLTGIIPTSLGRLSKLGYLYLSGNNFTGEIPSTLGNLTQLVRLFIGSNQLEGYIPPTLQNCSLEVLDLSFNKLVGSIPKEIMLIKTLAIYLGISHNMLTGEIPSEVGNLKDLSVLDVSENKISRTIPSSLGEALHLEFINLAGNLLEGPIPSSFSQLKGLVEVNFSRNNLSGDIPEFFGSFFSLTSLDLSFNNFEGELPKGHIFSNVTAFSIRGNDKLCGGPWYLNLPRCPNKSRDKNHLSQKLRIFISVAGGIVCLILLFAFRLMCISKRERRVSVKMEEHRHMHVTYAELLRATNGFSETNLIGIGSFGAVYKARLNFEEHNDVAIKVLKLHQKGASRSFIAECEVLQNIRHRNLVKILTVCSSIDFHGNDFKALVYDLMPKGSLDRWLHPQAYDETLTLSLVERLNISINVACTLEYLHNNEIVHCDLKPSNVLLDNDMVAHVGDFGLASFLNKSSTSLQNSSCLSKLKGSIGYVPPEYGVANEVSTKGDVYSYGILLLEMFTGKRPTDQIFQGGGNLNQYVASAFPEQLAEIVDPRLHLREDREAREYSNHAEGREMKLIISVLSIGISCSKELPAKRMSIEDVVRDLTIIRDQCFSSR